MRAPGMRSSEGEAIRIMRRAVQCSEVQRVLTARSSSRARRVKGRVGNFLFTSEMRARDAFTFKLYWFSTARRNTVVRCSVSRGCDKEKTWQG